MEQELEQQPEPQLSAVDAMKQRVLARERALTDFRAQREQLVAVEEAAKNWTFKGELGRAVWGAGVDLVTETAIVVKDAARYILPLDKVALSAVEGDWQAGSERATAGSKQASGALRGVGDVIAPENKTMIGSGARGIMQFMVPYVGWAKAAGTAQGLAAMTGRGFAIDMALFNPNEGNLSSLIKQLAPDHQNVVLDFLATDPDDDEALNRLRNGLEGAALGTALEAIFRVARFGINKLKVDQAYVDADLQATNLDDLKTPVEPSLPPGALDEALPEAADAKYFEVEDEFSEIDFDDKFAPQVDVLPPVVRAFHVTKAPPGTVLEARAPKDHGGQPEGLYFSLSKDDVKKYGPRGNNLREMEVDTRDFADITEVVGTREKGVPYSKAKNAAIEEARAAGKPGAVIRGDNFNTPELIVFDTKRVTKGNEPPAGARTAADEATPKPKDAALDGEAAVKAEVDLEETLRGSLKMTPEQRITLNRLLLEGDDEAVSKMLQKDFNLDTINWANIESADDIRKLITVTANVLADHIDTVKGGVQTHVQTKRLGNLVGLTGEQAHSLFKDIRGDKGIAARFHAAQRTLLASAKEVFRLRDIAKAAPGDLAKKAAFFRHVELHAALQSEIKGAQTEIARTLNGMAIIKQEAADGFKEFDALTRSMGKASKSGADFEKYMDDLLDATSLEDLNAKIRVATNAERFQNAFVEYVINAMLSSPKTHLINFTSNVLNTFVYSADRLVAGGTRRILFNDQAAWREAKIDLVRKFSSLDEALKLARQAWKDGAPVSDKRQRLEFMTRKAIQMETKGLAGGRLALAHTVNAAGSVIRVPGRLLITGDEFFKAVNRNSEIAVLAYREADRLATEAGLKIGTPKYEGFVAKAMKTLSDPATMTPTARNIRSQAIEKSRMVTFQESAKTGGGQKLEAAINANVYVKLFIAPFFRTPMNILRQSVIDRTPLGLFIKESRDVAFGRKGNPRERAEMIARMGSGIATMTGMWAFTGNGDDAPIQIIGKQAYDSSTKAAGVLDYSIRIGDHWFQFNRLEPLGLWVGMVADARTMVDHAGDDEKTFAFLQGALAGFLRNVVSKTWAQTLANFFDVIEGAATGEPAAVQRSLARLTSGEFGKLIPQVVKSVGKVALDDDERFAKEAWTFFDALSASLPVLNRGVPNRHDAIGRPITWANSAASILNPFAVSDNPSTPLDKELFRLDFTVRAMPKSLGGGLFDLTAAEYSRMTGLVGTLPIARGQNLEEALNAVVTSEDYATWTDERKVFVIKKYIEKARGAARATMLLDKDMQQRFKDAKVTDLSALLSD